MATGAHWTTGSIEDFVFKISSDFVFQIVKEMDAKRLSRKALAEHLGVSMGRVSQVLNNPGNLTLRNCVQYAQTLGMKVALVAYEDAADPSNNAGPINSEVFYRCWQRAGSPRDFFELAENRTVHNFPNVCSYLMTLTFLPKQDSEARDFVVCDPQATSMASTSSGELRISS